MSLAEQERENKERKRNGKQRRSRKEAGQMKGKILIFYFWTRNLSLPPLVILLRWLLLSLPRTVPVHAQCHGIIVNNAPFHSQGVPVWMINHMVTPQPCFTPSQPLQVSWKRTRYRMLWRVLRTLGSSDTVPDLKESLSDIWNTVTEALLDAGVGRIWGKRWGSALRTEGKASAKAWKCGKHGMVSET